MNERKDTWTVGAWMTANPTTVTPATSVRHAFYTMRHAGYRHLPVCDEGRLVGIVTDRDLRRPDISAEADGWNDYYMLDEDTEVQHVMTAEPVTLQPKAPLEDALTLIESGRFGAVPVVDKHGRLIGILTTVDLVRAFSGILKEHGKEIRARS